MQHQALCSQLVLLFFDLGTILDEPSCYVVVVGRKIRHDDNHFVVGLIDTICQQYWGRFVAPMLAAVAAREGHSGFVGVT